MASPDTDELATVPLPTGSPEGGKAASGTGPEGAAQPQTTPASAVPAAEEQNGPARPEAPTAEPERVEPAEASPEAASAARPGGRWWRGLTGSLAAGLTVLAIGVLAVAGICLFTGAPGPSATLLIGHPIAAALALLAQRVADRRNGPPAVGAGLAVVLFTVSALTLFWLT
ncbi:hypothetical protein [Amycolatopsis plumensis]|uniref:Uncharacterized protein n=1 Tax=Amycolatopsis plumensis TaxID=236508 RepID=A0ABV5U4L8_9PSEU